MLRICDTLYSEACLTYDEEEACSRTERQAETQLCHLRTFQTQRCDANTQCARIRRMNSFSTMLDADFYLQIFTYTPKPRPSPVFLHSTDRWFLSSKRYM